MKLSVQQQTWFHLSVVRYHIQGQRHCRFYTPEIKVLLVFHSNHMSMQHRLATDRRQHSNNIVSQLVSHKSAQSIKLQCIAQHSREYYLKIDSSTNTCNKFQQPTVLTILFKKITVQFFLTTIIHSEQREQQRVAEKSCLLALAGSWLLQTKSSHQKQFKTHNRSNQRN